ncbi:protein kinase domain-containing protein [Legionella drancourtii]|uniref:Protein kinase domain-containing protein n=1 Tax=Legionella drancourtii LLAP12 TaxID=658187 RepID=G9EKN1_9GAMM|nr:protein kinase [Legionella drancourtii]EHL32164.1 hypothetical protein LDG_5768 [Legionella drancourtii LLAP12]
MSVNNDELDNLLQAEKIRVLSQKAKEHFSKSNSHNIFEDGEDEFKIVRLYDKQENVIYFLMSQKLGAGAFGEVSRGIQLDIEHRSVIPNTDVAIKITDFSEGGTVATVDIETAKKETEHEQSVLSRIQQSSGFSIGKRTKKVQIKFDEELTIEKVAEVHEAIVAMPLYPGKDMQHKVHKDKFSYGSITFAELASKLCSNLKKLHDKDIIHSDLKPANIIWDAQNGHANIVDFNRAKFISPPETHVFSSSSSDKSYMAPDCFMKNKGYRFSKASDVYSLGKIFSEKFDITPQNGQKESLMNKNYLSYDQLIIKSFLEKMTSANEAQRPTIKKCNEFFNQLENKMKLDVEQPDNKTRLELSKKIISLEIYANQLRTEINQESRIYKFLASSGITADKTKKYEETIKTIELLTQALSTPTINKELLKEHQQSLYEAHSKASGILSFKGRYHKILESMTKSVEEPEQDNTRKLTKNL